MQRFDGPEAGGGVEDPLVGLVRAVIEQQGYGCTVIDADQLEIAWPGRSEPSRMYLTNLRQQVAREPRDQWPGIVSYFVDAVISAADDDRGNALDDYALVRPSLRTRLYRDDFQADMELVRRPVVPGLIEVLAIDKPTSVVLVSVDLAAKWDTGGDDLFTVARENVRADGPLEVEDEDFDGVRLFSLGGETAYVTAHALWAGDYMVTGRHGALVVLPTQGVMHATPVDGADVAAAMNLMVRVAWGGFQEGPRSVSPDVYWWRDGALRPAGAVEESDGTLAVSISPEFQDLLEALVRE
ncbi:hypothetical protein [Actinomadura sp. 9N407]|uniref:hypothetical protein n=1 Tax=Actinomadura sp. 9N407 TaxID=3375154 RepID=UPI0037BAE8EA